LIVLIFKNNMFIMRNIYLLLCLVISGTLLSQKYDLQQIHATQKFYLNNATREALGTGNSKTTLSIPLPDNTVEWYYSFSATREDGSQSLNLFGQLINILEPSGISGAMFGAITVPDGNAACNIYMTDFENARLFEEGSRFTYYPAHSRESYTEGVVKVNEFNGQGLYLCIENPANWEGATVFVEVTALVDTAKPEKAPTTEEIITDGIVNLLGAIQENNKAKKEARKQEEQFRNYWNTGRVFYESGDFETAMSYTQKALELGEHPTLYFNLGLDQWCSDSSNTCTATYLKGLNMIYQLESQEEAIEALEASIQDLEEAVSKYHFVSYTPPAVRLLALKLEEVKAVEKWKRRF